MFHLMLMVSSPHNATISFTAWLYIHFSFITQSPSIAPLALLSLEDGNPEGSNILEGSGGQEEG